MLRLSIFTPEPAGVLTRVLVRPVLRLKVFCESAGLPKIQRRSCFSLRARVPSLGVSVRLHIVPRFNVRSDFAAGAAASTRLRSPGVKVSKGQTPLTSPGGFQTSLAANA